MKNKQTTTVAEPPMPQHVSTQFYDKEAQALNRIETEWKSMNGFLVETSVIFMN